MSSSGKSERCWGFVSTRNNYTHEDVKQLRGIVKAMPYNGVSYIVWGYERAETGTPHLQLYVKFTKQTVINSAKKVFGDRFYLTPARGTAWQNRVYCTKPATKKSGTTLLYKY